MQQTQLIVADTSGAPIADQAAAVPEVEEKKKKWRNYECAVCGHKWRSYNTGKNKISCPKCYEQEHGYKRGNAEALEKARAAKAAKALERANQIEKINNPPIRSIDPELAKEIVNSQTVQLPNFMAASDTADKKLEKEKQRRKQNLITQPQQQEGFLARLLNMKI